MVNTYSVENTDLCTNLSFHFMREKCTNFLNDQIVWLFTLTLVERKSPESAPSVCHLSTLGGSSKNPEDVRWKPAQGSQNMIMFRLHCKQINHTAKQQLTISYEITKLTQSSGQLIQKYQVLQFPDQFTIFQFHSQL